MYHRWCFQLGVLRLWNWMIPNLRSSRSDQIREQCCLIESIWNDYPQVQCCKKCLQNQGWFRKWLASQISFERKGRGWLTKVWFKVTAVRITKLYTTFQRAWRGRITEQGGKTRLSKFKFSARFPIGLHVILQIQIKKIQKCIISYVKNHFNRKSIGVQPWTQGLS